MMIGRRHQRCELCSVGIHDAGALCASCSEMITRLSDIAVEASVRPIASPVAPRPLAEREAARLFQRALNINIFSVSEYKAR
jgi:hypothetical protein